jgi:hypothetical protein
MHGKGGAGAQEPAVEKESGRAYRNDVGKAIEASV